MIVHYDGESDAQPTCRLNDGRSQILHSRKPPQQLGRDYYADLYASKLEVMAEWHRYGAVEKANSIEYLLALNGLKPNNLTELGSGTGAVIRECQRRGLAREYLAIDYSDDAIRYIQNNCSGIHCMVADITSASFRCDEQCDVLIISHVLEHLENPLAFLTAVLGRCAFEHLVIEVPLEDLLASRIKNVVRDRRRNRAGHVQFFTRGSIISLLSAAGLQIVGERRYVPVFSTEILDFVCRNANISAPETLLKKWTNCYLPRVLRPLWSRFYYSHYAAMCRRPAGYGGRE